MKNILIIIILVIIVGCTIPNQNTSETTTSTTKEQNFIEEKGIVTDKLKFNDGETFGEIIKNKLTRTAEVKMTMKLNDSGEYGDFMGEQVATAPLMINMVCNLFAVAFFNRSALTELQESGNITIESEEDNPLNALEGYTVTKTSLDFIDYEDNSKIADCTATGGLWEDIKFNAYRKYESSFFGIEIGKIPKNEEDEN